MVDFVLPVQELASRLADLIRLKQYSSLGEEPKVDDRGVLSLKGYFAHTKLDFGEATIAPHATWVAQAAVRFKHPHLWSTDDPKLYRATLTASDTKRHRL